MKRCGSFAAVSQGLNLEHAEYGRYLADSGRITDELPCGEIPPLPPKLVLPRDPKSQLADSLWKHSRE